MINNLDIFNITTEKEFESLALSVFNFQFKNNPVYRSFCDLLYKHPSEVKQVKDIPFLPIQFFKTHSVLSSTEAIQQTFTSSGTTGQNTSKHHVASLTLYETSFRTSFNLFYGPN